MLWSKSWGFFLACFSRKVHVYYENYVTVSVVEAKLLGVYYGIWYVRSIRWSDGEEMMLRVWLTISFRISILFATRRCEVVLIAFMIPGKVSR